MLAEVLELLDKGAHRRPDLFVEEDKTLDSLDVNHFFSLSLSLYSSLAVPRTSYRNDSFSSAQRASARADPFSNYG